MTAPSDVLTMEMLDDVESRYREAVFILSKKTVGMPVLVAAARQGIEMQERAAMSDNVKMAKNTDRELWRSPPGDYYAHRVFVTEGGGIGIDVGGNVIVMRLAQWHATARQGIEAREQEHNMIGRLREAGVKMHNAKPMLSSTPTQEAGERIEHDSDCAVNNAPALPVGRCDCGATERDRQITAKAGEREANFAFSGDFEDFEVEPPEDESEAGDVAGLVERLRHFDSGVIAAEPNQYSIGGKARPLVRESAAALTTLLGEVERLTAWLEWRRNLDLESETQATIATLRAEVEKWRSGVESQGRLIAEDAVVIADLRAALDDLVSDCDEYSRINNLHNADGGPATNHAMRRARAALKPLGTG